MILKHAPRKPGTRDRLMGLLAYLAGPGRSEEHTDQRLVAAWDEHWTDIALRDPSEQADLAREMEMAERLHHMQPPKQGFVYHLPISLHADDGQLSEQQWAYVARKAVAKLGFDECRWVAVHHGLAESEQGPRDHIHLVVHRARDNGTVASTWGDYKKLAELRAELEDDPTLGLTVKTQRQGGGRSGWTHGERDRAARAGRSEPDREQLERLVRAAVGPAATEADWVRGMRASGVLVRPRFAAGGRSEVVGYSVALPPEAGQQPVWYGGGKLAKDLTLTAVRQRWDGHDPAESVGAWAKNAAAGSSTLPESESQTWPQASAALDEFERRLLSTPTSDTTSWRAYARETAEALSGLSTRAPAGERATLQRAATGLARAAEAPHGQSRGTRSQGAEAMRAACRVITSAAIAGQGGPMAIAQITVQLSRLSAAIGRARQAEQDAAAARMAASSEADLLALHRRISTARPPRGGSDAARLAAVTAPAQAPNTSRSDMPERASRPGPRRRREPGSEPER